MELTRAVLRLSGASMGQPCGSLDIFGASWAVLGLSWGPLGCLGVSWGRPEAVDAGSSVMLTTSIACENAQWFFE